MCKALGFSEIKVNVLRFSANVWLRFSCAVSFLFLVFSYAGAHSFGRFGFLGYWRLPGMTVSKIGIQSEVPGAYMLRFNQPAKTWRAKVTNPYSQTVALSGILNCPTKLSANLLSPNVAVDFAHGFSLVIHCQMAPFLTWKDGSVASNVPTPELNWVLISFGESQPPVLLSLPKGVQIGFKVVGKAGTWRIFANAAYSGWMKVGYPFGDTSLVTTTASAMGDMVNKFLPNKGIWTQDAPKLLGTKVSANGIGVSGEWVFSSAPILPPATVLARDGGYNLQILSKIKLLGCSTQEGPMVASLSRHVKIWFPDRKIPPGRYLAMTEHPPKLQESSHLYSQFIDLGLELLSSNRSLAMVGMAEDDFQNMLVSAQFDTEVWTGDRVTYDVNGNGLVETSAIAFLNECVSAGIQPGNAMLTSIVWSRDWYSWLPLENQAQNKTQRRSAAICAVAGAMAQDPATRLDSCLFEAGLAAQAALFHSQPQSFVSKKLIEPLTKYRQAIFGQQFGSPSGHSVRAIFSRSKVISAQRIWVTNHSAQFDLHWLALKPGLAQIEILLHGKSVLTGCVGGTVESARKKGFRYTYMIRTNRPGVCVIIFEPALPKNHPSRFALPLYSEEIKTTGLPPPVPSQH